MAPSRESVGRRVDGSRSRKQALVASASPNFRFPYVVHHHPVQNTVAASRIVADTAADRSPVGTGGIRTDHQAVLLQFLIHGVQVHAGLHQQGLIFHVQLDDLIHVTAEVQDNGGAYRLACQRTAAPAGQDGQSVLIGMLQYTLDVPFGPGQHHAQWHNLDRCWHRCCTACGCRSRSARHPRSGCPAKQPRQPVWPLHPYLHPVCPYVF